MGILGNIDSMAAKAGAAISGKIPKMMTGMSSGATTARNVGTIAMNRGRAGAARIRT